jgi:DNA invertase Pin-like site-specific DNA recombinase
MERDAITLRVREGIEAARRRGAYRGRQRGSSESPERFLQKPKNQRIVELLEDEYPITYIARIVGCSPNTVYKVRDTLAKVA